MLGAAVKLPFKLYRLLDMWMPGAGVRLTPQHSRLFGYMNASGWREASIQTLTILLKVLPPLPTPLISIDP